MTIRTACIGAAVALLGGCYHQSGGSGEGPHATAVLRDASGNVRGEASFVEAPGGGVRVRVRIQGIAPGARGIHIHTVGACHAATPTPFSSAGGHFNPQGRQHGRNNPSGWHGGDLPNLVVDALGRGTLEAVVEHVTLAEGPASLFDSDGSALVLHQNADDGVTDSGPQGPGNSGPRIACGVVVRG